MTPAKVCVRLALFPSERTRWQAEAKKFKMRLAQFVRMTVNAKLKIPTEDLVKKVERPKPEQMSLMEMMQPCERDTAGTELRCLSFP
ncbi:MAG: hypothetical protein PHX87_06560 [Candidatus Peribacteraceae bacterium]|nr:hypothetical protein [Candidatus Peribacteraceae bacterium]MDD5743051.1 hypothetical protein [Candidatus Peribacteraceae bacterium]